MKDRWHSHGSVAGFRDEVHGARGDVGCFRMFVGNARRKVVVSEQPAGEQFSVVAFGGIGPVFPRIGTTEAALSQIGVVSRIRVERPVGMKPVVALVRLEAAFGDRDADRGIRIDLEPFHALSIRDHMGLADNSRAHAERPQMIAERRLAHAQRNSVPSGAMRAAIDGRCNSSCGRHRRSATAHRRD